MQMDDNLLIVGTPSTGVLFAETLSPSAVQSQTPEIQLSALALLLAQPTPILSSDIQSPTLTSQPASVTESSAPGESLGFLQGITSWFLGQLQSTTLEATTTPQWTPLYTPATEDPAAGETPVPVPSPLVLGTPSGFFLGSQPTTLEPSSALEELTPSAAPLQTPPSSIKWFNTTT